MSSFIEDMEAPLQGRDDSIRLALNAPQPFSAGEVSQKDRAAQQLGTTYGMADAGWDDVQTEMKVQNASRVPKANEWVAEAQENVAFLNEDADALMSVYDDLVANGLLAESDIDRDTMETVAEDGNGLGKALDRARINNQLVDLGQSFLKGKVLGDDARREAARLHEELSRQEGNDPLGFYGAVEQLYRMGTRDLPNILYRGAQGALEGASAGAIAGTVIPGLGSVAGAGTGAAAGFTAGAARGTFESSQQMEAALFALDLLMQTDDAGQYLDDDTVKNYAQLYGMGSAFVETAGDALALKILSPVLKTMGAAIKRPASSVAKDAIKTAMSDRRLAPVLGRAVRGVAAGAAAEGAEESAQQAISEQIEALAKNTLNDAGVNYYREDQPGLFGKDAWGNIAESAVEGAKMGMWFHLLPGVTKFAIDTQSVLRAQEFSEANKNALKTIESSKTQQLSPVRMESFLKRQGLNQTVLVPADAAWQMQQAGTDIAGAFGWNIADMEEAAALGQDIAVPLSRIHAAQIPTDDKNTLFDVMRERSESMSAFEAMDESVLAEDVDAVNAAVEEWEYQQDRLDMELDRVRTQITESVRSSPVLLRQLTTSADTETSVGMYVDSVMRLLRNAADRLSVYGADADSILDRLNVQGLIRDEETGRMVDPVELEQLAEERAQAEADAPFWENVWGRLDAASLKRDFPEARKELASIHGRGLFAPRKGEGVPVDQLADELKTAGWLPEDADSSTLVEMLKEKRSPTRRNGSRGVRLNQAMAQSQADSLERFVEEARKGQIEFWKSDVTPSKLREIFNDRSLVINIPYDYIQHLDNRRPTETDALVANTEKIISEFDDLAEVISSSDYHNKRFIAAKYDGDIGTLVVFDRVISRKRGHRILPVTAYANRAQIIRGIIEKEKTLVLGPAISGQDTNIENDVIQGMSVLNEINIPPNGSESNTQEMLNEKRTGRRNGSEEIRLNQNIPAPDIEYPDGGKPVGEVTPEIAATLQLNKPGVIVLDDTGIQHIEDRHGEQLRQKGFKTIEDFVSYVLDNFDAVYLGNQNNSYELVCRGNEPFPKVTIKLKFENVGEYYRISNAQFIRSGSFKKKTPLWEKAPTSHSSNEEPYRAYLSQSGVSEENISPNGSESNTLFQTAYHGTPHKFDEFSLEYIGEGEGAQAHGWGLYFAADKKVSDDYRNRLRRGRSRGQLFEVDIPNDDVLLDEQKIFAEQPEAVKSALRSIYKSFSKEQLAPVREEMKAQVRRDKELEKRGEELTRKRQRLFNQRRALKTVNAQRPKGEGNPFSKEGSAKLFELGEKYLHEMYSDAQIEHLQHDADYLNAEKAAVEKKIADLEQKIEENEQRIETKRAKERASIDKARIDTLLTRMNGSDLYSGISIVLDSPKAASEMLNDHGIKGITYDGQQDGRSFVVFDDKAIQVLNTFYQGQNALAARFASMPLIEADSSLWFGPGKAVDANKRNMRKAVQAWSKTRFPQGSTFHNQDRGWDVQISPRGITKTLSHGFDETLARSIPFIPQIVESGIYIADGKIEHGMQTHIFANKINLDGQEYVVGFVVREDQNGRRFYDHELTEIIDPGSLNAASLSKDGEEHATRANRGIVMNILRDRLGVNDGSGQVLFQPQETGIASQVYATATGSISSQNGNYYIQLFRGANLSTLAHETMHAVHLEMERLEREGLGTPELKRDLDALRSWTARMDDDANLKSEYDKYQRSMQQFGGRKFEELTPEEVAISRSIAKEEMVARGFEAYLREGVSPSRGMEGVFRRFKKWLTRIYRQATLLDVELTDDVRRVFDNIVASDEDIRAAAAVNNIRTESSELMDALGLRGADRLELESLVREAEDNAADALRKDKNKAIREQAKKWEKEAEEEIRNETVYRVRTAMRKTPIDYESVVESYGRDMADRLMKKLPASVKRGGDNPESLAFDYGFRNAGEMIQAVLDAPGINERRTELIVQKRHDAEARFAAEDYLFEQDALARKEERIGEAVYRLEAEGRTSLGVPIQGNYRERSKALREQIRMQAERILDGKAAADAVRPDIFRRSASKALREERQAILAKDWTVAIQANYRARINLELARQAADRRDLVEKLQKQAKKFLDSKVTDPGARFGVFVLAMKTRLINPTMKMLANAGDKTFDNIKSFLSKMREEGLYTEDAAIKDELFSDVKLYWPYMSWENLSPYLEAMSTMMHMERVSRKAHDEQNSVEWRQKMDGLAAGIYAHNKNRSKGSFHKDNLIIKRLKEFHASHLKADTICRLLDGDEDMGPVWRAVIRPINQATWNRATRMRKERDAIKELYSVYSPAEWVDIRGRRYYVDAIKTSITKEQALAVLLNAGNESNFKRLLNTTLEGGVRITEAGIRAVIDTLDERDVKFVQSVWDYLETFRKESFDLEEEISGVRPKAIEAQPVQTKYGVLRGGYYPVSYDAEQSSLPIDNESIGTLTGSAFPSVDHGSMKQRTNGLSSPVTLDLEVLPRHVVKTVHMLAFRKPVQQVARVLNDNAVIGAIESTAGVEHGKALKSWLHYVAGERPASNGWSRTLGWFRKNAALYAMGIRLTTLLAQTTGFLAATAELGPRWVICGLVRTYCQHNPFMVYQETAALSPMMANRMQSVDRDLHEMSTGLMKRGSNNRMLNPVVKFYHWQQEKAYLPMGFVQMACADLPTWQGAYAKALHEGKSRDAAIEYADNVVERTQVGGEDKDLAAIQRGSEMGKIMTQFYSFFSALYQLYARRMTMLKRKGFTDVGAWGRLGTLFLLTGVLEPILSALVTGDTPDDDDDWYAWGARKIFFNPFNMVIGLRDITGAVEGYMEGYGGRARVGSLVNDVIDTGVRFGTQIEKGLDMDARKMFDSGWKLAGLATGAVNSQELLIINAFWDWLDGTNPDFELADLIRKKK